MPRNSQRYPYDLAQVEIPTGAYDVALHETRRFLVNYAIWHGDLLRLCALCYLQGVFDGAQVQMEERERNRRRYTMHDDLNAQVAQKLFGERWLSQTPLWTGRPCPAYTTDPIATAKVLEWLEGHASQWILSYCRSLTKAYRAEVWNEQRPWPEAVATGDSYGTTWQDALCRAAVALADALREQE